MGSGGGEGSAGRARSSPRQRAEGRCGEAALSSPLRCTSSSLFYCCRSILPGVNSAVKASSSMAPVSESQPSGGSRRRRRRRRLVRLTRRAAAARGTGDVGDRPQQTRPGEEGLEERPPLWVRGCPHKKPRRHNEPHELGVRHSREEGDAVGGRLV